MPLLVISARPICSPGMALKGKKQNISFPHGDVFSQPALAVCSDHPKLPRLLGDYSCFWFILFPRTGGSPAGIPLHSQGLKVPETAAVCVAESLQSSLQLSGRISPLLWGKVAVKPSALGCPLPIPVPISPIIQYNSSSIQSRRLQECQMFGRPRLCS